MERLPQSAAAQVTAVSCASRAAAAAIASSFAQRPQSLPCAGQCAAAQAALQYTAERQPTHSAREIAEQPGAMHGEPIGAVGRGAGGEDDMLLGRARRRGTLRPRASGARLLLGSLSPGRAAFFQFKNNSKNSKKKKN